MGPSCAPSGRLCPRMITNRETPLAIACVVPPSTPTTASPRRSSIPPTSTPIRKPSRRANRSPSPRKNKSNHPRSIPCPSRILSRNPCPSPRSFSGRTDARSRSRSPTGRVGSTIQKQGWKARTSSPATTRNSISCATVLWWPTHRSRKYGTAARLTRNSYRSNRNSRRNNSNSNRRLPSSFRRPKWYAFQSPTLTQISKAP
mmetsp:Transcript_9304/g.27764  ORF Transcript_9304/g.27764 Transcript_9304/m.27764 type:complete len:202 (+) Transcript_9304:349-954(+)